MTETAVVILNYNGKEWLRKFLPSVIRFSPQALIVVADNNSDDGSADIMASEFPEVRLVRISENLGFCGGYNFTLKQVEARYYVLLNSDVEVTEGWLDPVLELFRHDPDIGAAQPKILSHSRKNYFEYAGAAGGFVDTLAYPFCRGRIFNHLEEDKQQYNDTVEIFWATGACLFVRSDIFHKLGGLDEDFFAHMDEIDFCWRMRRAGFKAYYQGKSCVYHYGGGTLPPSNPRKTYLNFKNGLSILFRHSGASGLIIKFPLRIVLDWVASLKFLLDGQPLDSLAVLKAHLHFLGDIGKEIKKRRLIKTPFHKKLVYRRSIVFDFYILGKRLYSELNQ